MALVVLFALIITPILEIAVFMKVGTAIGVWSTLALVLFTAVLGTWLLRQQGLAALWRMREGLSRGEAPVDAVFDGAFLLFAGALLLTPGFVTDGVGLLLFMPLVRRLLKAMIGAHLLAGGRVQVWPAGTPGRPASGGKPFRENVGPPPSGPAQGAPGPGPGGVTIEGEFTDLTDGGDGEAKS